MMLDVRTLLQLVSYPSIKPCLTGVVFPYKNFAKCVIVTLSNMTYMHISSQARSWSPSNHQLLTQTYQLVEKMYHCDGTLQQLNH